MASIRTAAARHWKVGILTFAIVLALCVVSVWKKQPRYNVVFTFEVTPISRGIELPGLGAISPGHVTEVLKLSLEHRALRASVTHHGVIFSVTVGSIPERNTQRVQQDLSTVYQQLVDDLSDGVDATPLFVQVESLDAQLALVGRTLQSTTLSDYERYALEREALLLGRQRKEVGSQLAVVSKGMFEAPISRLYRAEQMANDVLILLSLILSAFLACAVMVVADSLTSNT